MISQGINFKFPALSEKEKQFFLNHFDYVYICIRISQVFV